MMLYQDLERELYAQLSQEELQWLSSTVQTLRNSTDINNDILDASVFVKRKIQTELKIQFTELKHCDSVEVFRIFFLLTALNASQTTTDTASNSTPNVTPNIVNLASFLKKYYQGGDSAEKSALLKGLLLLDEKGEAVNVAINATRCNSVDEYTALALNNAYPGTFFPELNFNQLVLKTLFMGLAIDELLLLSERCNSSLSNMCFSYAVEQALAERIPPASLWLAIKYVDLTTEHQADFEHYIQHFSQHDAHHKDTIARLIELQELTFVKCDNTTLKDY
ncbi:EboA domain-containing protein [Colwellia sp. E2M01]|uniref:EboA domain-containing protein n=1 Tax=Colwellia sp. E2M01 TaxID=2841561 RepID=UPI001C09F75F|nr:EboA domain-containing protein [Colwellia sp. E2M01]MBU2869435.1 EboA domain-containing protein [Colwellia sp. E2M01]